MVDTPLQRLLKLRAQIEVPGAGKGATILQEVLTYMHAPENLEGVYKVSRNSIELFDLAVASLPHDSDLRDQLRRYRAEVAWVKRTIRKFIKRLSSDVSIRKRMLKRANKNPLLSQGAMEHGLWCLLWHRHTDESIHPIFSLLQLRGTCAQFAALRYWSGREEWAPGQPTRKRVIRGLYRETLAIRNFVTGKDRKTYEGLLHEIAAEGPTMDTIAEALKKVAASHAPRGEEKPSRAFRALCSILWLFDREVHPDRVRSVELKFIEEVLKQEGENAGTNVAEPEGEYDLDRGAMDQVESHEERADTGAEDEAAESGGTEVETIIRRRWTREELQECSKLGLHPSEVLPTSALHLSNRRSGPRGQQNWRARDNQLLPWSLQDLPLEIAAEALEIVRLAFETGGVEDIELFALTITILRLGCTMPAALEITVCSRRPKDEDVKTLTLVLPPDRHLPTEWVLPVLPIPFEAEPVLYDGCRKVVKAFVLPDFGAVGSVVRRLLDERHGQGWEEQPVQPFRSTKKEYARRLSDCLSKGGSEEGRFLASYCTFERLSMIRFRRIYSLAGENVIPATYLTLRTHDSGEVPRYYETPQVATIQNLDRDSMIAIFKALQTLGLLWPIDESMKPSESHGYVGSPFCPTMEALKGYLEGLRSSIIKVNHELLETRDPTFLIPLHNLYATYTQVGYLIGTCHRAVQNAYANLDEIEPSTRLLRILDKKPRGRLVPVCDIIWTQMLAFREYISDANYLKSSQDMPIFLLASDLSAVTIGEGTLKLPWPMNFGRHFVRTELATAVLEDQALITIEQLKEFLGHAAEGEERDGASSTFNYLVYSRAMRAAMKKLLEEIEYWPINIRGARLPVRDSSYVRASAP